MMKAATGKMTAGAEATLINIELSMMRDAIVRATDAHSQRREYRPEKTMTTAMIKFISGAFVGRALLGMVVTLSPAGQNGWETWFSLEYGQSMASLRSAGGDRR